jgi:roadblock/LC7 domain-containing protein
MLLLTLAMPNNAFSKSAENKAACVKWCKANQPACVKCYANTTCGGKSWKVIKSFKKGTGNWYACGLSDYGRESRKNKTDCEAWCKKDNRCKYCKDTSSCGAQHSAIKKFGGLGGRNWYACGLTKFQRQSAKNREACNKFCENSPICDFCSTRPSCSFAGYGGLSAQIVKRFKGYGDNWYACRFTVRGMLAKEREAECEKMCKATDMCDYCAAIPCHHGDKIVARFRGRGDTIYACKRR